MSKIIDIPGNRMHLTGVDYVAGNSGIDSATETLQTITYEHHEIHAGSHFMLCGFETLANNAQANFVLTTPNTTTWTHMTFEIEGTSQTEMYIYEGATVTGGTGAAATAFNNNRNSAKTSTLSILKNPTTTADGTLIFSQSKGLAGANPSKATSEGIVSREREIILKQNTTYIFRIISKANGNIVTYCGEWYEHTNKN